MKQLLDNVLEVAEAAGELILEVYDTGFEVDYKDDGSPLTVADRRAHREICRRLAGLTPEIPVVSEESEAAVFEQRLGWDRFWLVDPLDGTREFVKRNGEFTVNIALIENGAPVLGVVHTPVKRTSHFAARGVGAFRRRDGAEPQPIRIRTLDPGAPVMVASRSHSGAEVEQYRAALERRYAPVRVAGMGSSLKICLVAEGEADIYPRLGPTSEWDTAAAQCVLETAGGALVDIEGAPLRYNKPDILNPWFLACGDPKVAWTEFLGDAPVPAGKSGGKAPNDATRAAMTELGAGEGEAFDSTSALMADMNEDDRQDG